mmetsp:Transcript_17128/g.56035  ORF Transcript_17128/g.56035 Transcript_17128/m.56035 type:complete len:213 (-) Transcript_17128:417-1055(-)
MSERSPWALGDAAVGWGVSVLWTTMGRYYTAVIVESLGDARFTLFYTDKQVTRDVLCADNTRDWCSPCTRTEARVAKFRELSAEQVRKALHAAGADVSDASEGAVGEGDSSDGGDASPRPRAAKRAAAEGATGRPVPAAAVGEAAVPTGRAARDAARLQAEAQRQRRAQQQEFETQQRQQQQANQRLRQLEEELRATEARAGASASACTARG